MPSLAETLMLAMGRGVESLEAKNKKLRQRIEELEWKDMSTAPKDGKTIELIHRDDAMPTFYSAWWLPGEGDGGIHGDDWDGHYWVLNDGVDILIEEDTDLSKWGWRAAPQPINKESV